MQSDTEILVVAPDDPADLKRYWESESLPFTVLPDPDHHVANLYRQEVNLLKLGRMPAVLIISKDGTLAFQHFGASMSDIPKNQDVLAHIAQLENDAKTDEKA